MLAYMCMCYQKKKGIKTQSKVYCQNISLLNFLIIPKASPDKFDFRKYRAFKKSYCIISRNSKDLSNFYLGYYTYVSQSFSIKRKTETKLQRKIMLT